MLGPVSCYHLVITVVPEKQYLLYFVKSLQGSHWSAVSEKKFPLDNKIQLSEKWEGHLQNVIAGLSLVCSWSTKVKPSCEDESWAPAPGKHRAPIGQLFAKKFPLVESVQD